MCSPDLPAGQRLLLSRAYQDLSDLRTWSEPVTRKLHDAFANSARRHDRLVGRHTPARAGVSIQTGRPPPLRHVRRAQHGRLINVGDTIYADQPRCGSDAGRRQRMEEVVTPAKSKVAESLEEFRGCHRYNLGTTTAALHRRDLADRDVGRSRGARQLVLGAGKDDDARYRRSRSPCAARARQAFVRVQPAARVRDDPSGRSNGRSDGSSRRISPSTWDLQRREQRRPPAGARRFVRHPRAAQLHWLKASLTAARRRKIVAADLPRSFGRRRRTGRYEAVANGDPGAPLGRELEIADLLRDLKRSRVRNVVWIPPTCTTRRARIPSHAREVHRLRSFWEFVAGPLNAGTFGPNALDPTFGPEVKFVGIPPA